MDVLLTVLPAIVAGILALVASLVSFLLSTRAARRDFASKLDQVRLEASESRRTVLQQYRLDAEREFLAAVGPASGQVVEAIHDLTDRLFQFFGAHSARAPAWLEQDGYYRRTLIWLMVRPLGWLEVLRRRQTRVDPTIGTPAIAEHQRFLTACHFFERSFSSLRVFEGLGYDASSSTAHLFYGTVRQASEATVTSSDGTLSCITYTEFLERLPVFREPWLGEFERILAGVSEKGKDADLRRARLAAIYVASCFVCAKFPISYRPEPEPKSAVHRLWTPANPPDGAAMKQKLIEWIDQYETRLASYPSASVLVDAS